jgi:hypothetical protein
LTSFKLGAWEVEIPAMDVQADETGLLPDPSATAIFERPVTGRQQPVTGGQQPVRGGHQQQLFADAYPTYADTDQIPATPGGRRGRAGRGGNGQPGSSRLLRVAVVLVGVAVLAAGAALGLVKTGVIRDSNSNGNSNSTAQPPQHTPATVPKAPLLTQISTGGGTASYRIDIAAYAVTVATTTGRSWVAIGITGHSPSYEGILAAASSQKEILIGSSTVNVGAGGTKLIVTSGHRSATLTPPSAPFTYQFMAKG